MERLGRFFSQLALRFLPDALVLAVLLTIVVMAAALLAPPAESLRGLGLFPRIAAVADLWLQGVANPGFLEFALQMCLILLTGYGLAKAPAATRLLEGMASLARSNRSAAALVALTSAVGCWINWGFGLITAGLLAAQIRDRFARRNIPCQFPLIVAAAYVGMMTWHGGLSGSAPLRVGKDGVEITRHVEGRIVQANSGPITINHTVFAPANLILTLGLFAGIPLAMRLMAGKDRGGEGERGRQGEDVLPRESPCLSTDVLSPQSSALSFAERINHARWLRAVLVIIAVIALVVRVERRRWAAVDLTFVNVLFLAGGLTLHRDLMSYLAAFTEGGRAVTGIIIQFPLYGGIERIMAGSGLVTAISNLFVSSAHWMSDVLGAAPGDTFPLATFASACVVNMFIPSGGVQWIVQGPIMCSAADHLNLPLAQTVMAVAYGDEYSNMLQPFWAIPLMGLTQVNPRQFMGYCALFMLLATPAFILALIFF